MGHGRAALRPTNRHPKLHLPLPRTLCTCVQTPAGIVVASGSCRGPLSRMEPTKYSINVLVTRDHSHSQSDTALHVSVDVQTIDDNSRRLISPNESSGATNTTTAVDMDNRMRFVSTIPAGSKLVLSVNLPTDDPAKRTDEMRIAVDSESLQGNAPFFFVKTNVKGAQGEVWRTIVNFLRRRFCSSGDVEEDDQKLMHSVPIEMNPGLIRHFLTTEERPRYAVSSLTISSAAVGKMFPVPIGRTEGPLYLQESERPTVDVSVSAPTEYSRLNIVDTLLTVAQELAIQSVRAEQLPDLETACVSQWIAVNLSYDHRSPEYHLVAVLEFTQTLFQLFQTSQDSYQLDVILPLLYPSIVLAAEESVPDIHRDRLISHLVAVLMAAQDVFEPSHRIVETGIQWCSDVLLVHPPRRPACINNVSQVFMKRFSKLGKLNDLATNITLLQKALPLFSPSDPQRANTLYNLVRSLNGRQLLLHDISDLELALRYSQELLDLEARGDAGDNPRCLILMSRASLVLRHDDLDVNDAVTALREAMAVCPLDHAHRFELLAQLSQALVARHNRYPMNFPGDLEEAFNLRDQALELAPASEHIRKAYILAEQVAFLFNTCNTAEQVDMNQLDQAIHLGESVIRALANDPDRHGICEFLGRSYLLRYIEKGDNSDIELAHGYLSSAVEVASAGAGLHSRAKYSAALATVYRQPGARFFDLEKAYQCIEECLKDAHADAMDRLSWMRYGLRYRTRGSVPSTDEDEQRLAQLSLLAVRLLPGVAYIGMDTHASLTALRRWESMAMEAAVLCHYANLHYDAVQVVEEGRAIFWSQALKMRPHGMDDLPAEMKTRLIDLSNQISRPNGLSSEALEYARKRRLGEELESLLTQIRSMPGHEEFGIVSVEQLLRAGEKGPVVILVSHGSKCIAYSLIKRDSQDSFTLGVIDLEVNRLQLQQLISYLDDANDHSRKNIERGIVTLDSESSSDQELDTESSSSSSSEAARAVRRHRTQGVTENVLRPLWYNVAKPIISALNITKNTGRDRTRFWWCPTGDFTFLPLHAAGDYRLRGESCSAYIVFSYTPTLAALVNARKTFEPVSTRDAKVLLAAAPHPFEGLPLKGTVAELKQIATVIPRGQLILLPTVDDAVLNPNGGITVQTAMKVLPETSILHLASHGVQDHTNPLNSAFILRDAKLTIAQLIPLPMPHAFLAFLSACETAKGDDQQKDQAIHLAATMLFAGFKSVIGTMWSMADVDGPHVAGHVYRQIFANRVDGGRMLDPDEIPYALDEAIEELRSQNVPPSRWATFIHLGM